MGNTCVCVVVYRCILYIDVCYQNVIRSYLDTNTLCSVFLRWIECWGRKLGIKLWLFSHVRRSKVEIFPPGLDLMFGHGCRWYDFLWNLVSINILRCSDLKHDSLTYFYQNPCFSVTSKTLNHLTWKLLAAESCFIEKDGCWNSAFNLAQLLAGNPRCIFFQWPLLVICRHWILCSQPQHLWKSIDSHDMHLGLEKERFGFKQFLGWYWFMLTGLGDGLVHGWGWGWWCRWWWGGGGWMWMRRRTVIMIL